MSMNIDQDRKLPKGILNPLQGEQKFSLTRYEPSPDTGYLVQHYWVVAWDLRGQPAYPQTVLAHPNVNLVFEPGRTRIYGLARASSTRVVEGNGWVVGVKFKPGGFYPYYQSSVSELTGGSVDFKQVFLVDSREIEEEIFAQGEVSLAVDQVDRLLREHLPEPDPNVQFVSDLVYSIRDDRSIVKVEDAVKLSGMHKRTLQRLFDRYVGVSPKGVIQRYRLHEAADRISCGADVVWTELSLELGYYDQSHFIRDFKAILGLTPEEFARLR
jgi:AraC-like DNA-binding protein